MPNQEESRDGDPRKGGDRASPQAERGRAEDPRREGGQGADSEHQDDRGHGPGKIGLTSDAQPDLVAPSGMNERDHGAADDKPMAGGSLNFDDDDMAYPRGRTPVPGGTRDAPGGDSAPLGPPGAGLSDRNGPSDPDSRKQ